jgi:hypothetical protein
VTDIGNCALLGYYASSIGNSYHRFGTSHRSRNVAIAVMWICVHCTGLLLNVWLLRLLVGELCFERMHNSVAYTNLSLDFRHSHVPVVHAGSFKARFTEN